MPNEQPPQLRISEPAEIAQVIPYLVGFTPENSLVVSALDNNRIQVTARINLDQVQPTGGVELLLQRIWDRHPDASGMAVAYTDDHLAGWDVLSRCDAWLPHGCVTMLVDGDTWQTADGTTGTIDPHGELATQVAGQGLRTLPTRSDLAARFDSAPNSDEFDRNLGTALAGLPEPRDITAILQLTRTLIDRNLPTDPNRPNDLSPVDAIQLSVLAQHPAARDLALLQIDRNNAADHLSLWQHVIQATPAHGADLPLYIAGMAAWISGDGASATIAVERALEHEQPTKGRHPAILLEGIIDNVIPPTAWDEVRHDLIAGATAELKAALGHATPPMAAEQGWPPTEPSHTARREFLVRKPPAPGIAI